jgi:hypothetical protein
MKTFRHPLGHVRGKTMTVGELREKLCNYPPDMPVLGQWEGTWNNIRPDGFEVLPEDECHPDDRCDVLIIDVEDH